MNKVQIEAVIPVPVPRFDIDEIPRRQIRLNTLSILKKRNGIQSFDFCEYGIVFPTFIINETTKDSDNQFQQPSFLECRMLNIILEVDIPDEIEVKLSPNNEIETIIGREAVEFHKSNIMSLFEKRIYDYAFAINLSHSNSLKLSEGIIRFKGDQYSVKTKRLNPDFILDAFALSQKKQWPKFKNLSIDETWLWLKKQKGFMEGFGGGRTGRALNSIVNISFQKNYDSPESLFWAMVGLESIFTSGKSGLLEQVRDKSQVLLGQQTSFKKILNDMYNFRSRFVHGDLDFATPHHLYDSDEIMKYYFDVSESLQIAVAVLICSIQELISRNWNNINFTYVVEELKEAD